METVLEALKGINAYPVPPRTIQRIAEKRGIVLQDEVADLLQWLSEAPNVSQGGQSYTFSDGQRTQLRNRANSLYKDFGADKEAGNPKPIYGYKGSRL